MEDWERNSWEIELTPEEEDEEVDIVAVMDAERAADPAFAAEVDRAVEAAEAGEGRRRSLVAIRQAMNLTQTQLAERLGVKQPTVSDLERGRYENISARTLMTYLAALGVRPRLIIDVPGQGDVDVTALAAPAA